MPCFIFPVKYVNKADPSIFIKCDAYIDIYYICILLYATIHYLSKCLVLLYSLSVNDILRLALCSYVYVCLMLHFKTGVRQNQMICGYREVIMCIS